MAFALGADYLKLYRLYLKKLRISFVSEQNEANQLKKQKLTEKNKKI